MSSVSVSGSITTGLTIRFYPGWWLVDLRKTWDGNINNQPSDISGLKHWIYLDNNTEDGYYEVQVNSDEMLTGNEVVLGLNIESDYYQCCSDGEVCDPDLADNASGVPNSASCGADRYGINVLSAGKAVAVGGDWGTETDTEGTFADRENLSLVCKVDLGDSTVRYMNNMIIHKL